MNYLIQVQVIKVIGTEMYEPIEYIRPVQATSEDEAKAKVIEYYAQFTDATYTILVQQVTHLLS
jgi:hypothetical protein